MFILHKVEVTSFEIWLKIYIDKQEVVRHLASNSGRNIPRERETEREAVQQNAAAYTARQVGIKWELGSKWMTYLERNGNQLLKRGLELSVLMPARRRGRVHNYCVLIFSTSAFHDLKVPLNDQAR